MTAVDDDLISQKRFSSYSDIDVDPDTKYFEYDSIETKIYGWWESSDYFKPSTDKLKKPYVIPMPPPNVTGYLHMGHAMYVTVQDVLARFHRMRGRSTLWLPGTDHAGIATQLVVERALKAEGKSRTEIGREAFVENVWKWKEEKGGYITGQMRSLGASADWTRERFTLEPSMSEAVTEAFVRLHEKGLVYKGDYLVNWSPSLQTAVSDLEVEYTEEQGKLYFFKYMLADGSGHIPVSTTRPETILGDTALCVHPDDERYQSYIGKTVLVPILGREVTVIADTYVDREFGTGALKITPAHDPNDYEIGKRYDLPMISIMNKDGTINEQGGDKYTGLDRFVCRKRLWEDMEEAGLVLKVEPHQQRVPRSQRGGEIIEPLVSSQWFVRMKNMGDRAVDAVKNGDIEIIPNRFEKVWYNWLENVHDWCVSRQLWWGHRIPVYYIVGSDRSEYFVARSLEEAYTAASVKYGNNVELEQEEDVLDTWFSSGLWPFATVGWPGALSEEADSTLLTDYNRFYPAHLLETGYDILFFWVARMVMMGLEFTDQAPFKTIYLHGLVRDAQGRKMSKSIGNVIDPLDTIKSYGCDALRFTLVTGGTPGQDIPLSTEKVEASRNFVNKIWNMGKFIKQSQCQSEDIFSVKAPITAEEIAQLALPERWVISQCHALAERSTILIEKYDFGEAGRQAYEFLWNDLADWYIEASKVHLRESTPEEAAQTRRVLAYVWDRGLRMLHPFMPFITEALWQQLASGNPSAASSIMISDWPVLEGIELEKDEDADRVFSSMQNLIRAIRNARAEYNVEAGKKISAAIIATGVIAEELMREKSVVATLARVDEMKLTFHDVGFTPKDSNIRLVIEEGLEVFLPLSGLVDKEKELLRLRKQEEKLSKEISGLQGRLSSKKFVEKAPEHVVEEVKETVADKIAQLAAAKKSILDLDNVA
eukprot:CAMPEP_0182423794 /NCGR_PEP_ID=MMETSP1167-20130531/9869_1 /TAXON_ID=2988 /ORGANISM="Mallomonas Sp, Strain CCMP3275" /LENGTH=935 /DNA_ID=CAMNT_0024603069 /DNA_START=286 /DNA_END=3093 /DNA_ORIENTATION=+